MSTYKPNAKILPFVLLALLGILFIYDAGVEQEIVSPEIISETLLLPSQNTSSIQTKKIHIVNEGENLSLIFEKYQVSLNNTYKIFRKDKSDAVKNILPNDRLEFIFLGEELQEIHIHKGPLLSYQIEVFPQILIKRIDKKPVLLNSFKTGVIESSFYLAGLKNDIPESVIMDLAYIFGWDIDFVFDIRKGDSIKLLYEDIYFNGTFFLHGDIIAAEFINQGDKLSVVRFSQKGRKDYYTTDSNNVRKAFLRTPIELARISSHYNPNRKHPVLNTIRAHKGTDYAAKTGTPVKVTGDGVIKNAQYSNSYGNYIDVMHYNKYMTRYAHLQGFAKGIRKGAKVTQGETIGYVGSTGLATGPHLHYEFHINGKHTDPVKVEPPNAQSINSYNKKYFDKLVDERTEIISNISSIQ